MKSMLTFLLLVNLTIQSFSLNTLFDPKSLFKEFWDFVDKNYIYFDLKGVNWNEVYDRYNAKISQTTSEDELFEFMENALLELKDAHNRILRPGQYGKFYNFRDGYDIYFEPSVIRKNYYRDSLGQTGNLFYAMLENNIGYIYLPAFSKYDAFPDVLKVMKANKANKVIIDVRSNSGGNSNTVPKLLGHFIQNKSLLGYYVEKTGPGHLETCKPVGVYAQPDQNFYFDMPIVVLINRGCYSATTYFTGMIKGLPNVTLVGQRTGGGAGGNFGFQLSNGWQVAVTVSDFLDKSGKSAECGVEPNILIENTKMEIESGKDNMLETAMKLY